MTTSIPAPVKHDPSGNVLAFYAWTFPRSDAYEAAVGPTLPPGWVLYSVIDADKDPEQCGRDYGATREDGRAHVHGIREADGAPRYLRATFPDRVRGQSELADKLFRPDELAAACRWCDEQLAGRS